MLLHISQVDQPLDLGQFLKTKFLSPPALAQIPDPLGRLRARNAIGTGQNRPAFLQVEVGKSQRVFVLPDVLGHDGASLVAAVDEIAEEEARIGCLECNARRQTVEGDRLFDPSRHIRRVHELWGVLHEHVDGKDKVVRRPRMPVAPLDTRTDFDHEFGVILIETVALGDPRY